MRDGGPTKARIQREALRQFVAQGVDAVSVRDIAAKAGIQPSTLYVHWKSKEELVADLFRTGYAQYGAAINAIAVGPQPFQERLKAIVETICRLHDDDTILFRFILLTQHGQLQRVGTIEFNPIDVLQRMIAAAMDAGELRAGDAALMTAAVVGIVVQTATFLVYARIQRSMSSMAEEISALCLQLFT